MSKSVLLINAPFLELYGSQAVAYYFPMGIGYIASFLEKNGYDVKLIVEAEGRNVYEDAEKALQHSDYLFVGISCMTPAYPAALRLARMCRNYVPGVPVVLGGPHAGAVGAEILAEQPEFDFVCLGEGELPALELARKLESGEGDFDTIRGLAFRRSDGQIMSSPVSFHAELDELPYPARHLVNFDDFSLHSHLSLGEGHGATMITSRGCPYQCIFCSAHVTHGRKYRFHSDDYVINEMKLLKEKYNIRYIFFEDDTFTVVKQRVKRLCQRMMDEKTGVRFGCFSRVDVFDDEMAGMLSAAGCKMIIFGIESGDQEVLDKIRKGINLDHVRNAISLCRKHKIKSYASFVVGLPFEDRRRIEKTLAFGKSLNASIITFNPFVPFPGTPLFEPEKHKPKNPEDWSRFLTTDEPPFDVTPGVTAKELKAMVDRAHMTYYLHPSRLFRIIADVRSYSEFMSMLKSFLHMLRKSVNA